MTKSAQDPSPKTFLALGYGYSARALAESLMHDGWRVLGTYRDAAKRESVAETGAEPVAFTRDALEEVLPEVTHILMSAAPTRDGHDPALAIVREAIARRAPALDWVGYLSTTGVYGDAGGDWVDETSPLNGHTPRATARIRAEADWAEIPDLPLHIFRLAGIYGPGRGPFEKIRKGTARRIIKDNQIFSRIHVDDIAQVLRASMARPNPGAAYNVCDDEPAPPQDVLTCAAELLGVAPPPEVAFEDADMSPMARSFYADSKRVSNRRIREELEVDLLYPGYRVGLQAVLAAEKAE
jgi:nucleoside-diphosphate-sugar epimerase